MIPSTQNTTYRIHNVPWVDYKNVPDWPSAGSRDVFFDNTGLWPAKTGHQFIKENSTFGISIDYGELINSGANYITYDNADGAGRQHAFIKNIDIASKDGSLITIETDVWTTYLFDHIPSGTISVGHVNRWMPNSMLPTQYFMDSSDAGQLEVSSTTYYSEDVVWFVVFCSELLPNFLPSLSARPLQIGGSLNTCYCYMLCNKSVVTIRGDQAYECGMQKALYYNTSFFKSENILGIYALPFAPFRYNYDFDNGRTVISEPTFSGEFVEIAESGGDKVYAIYVENFGNYTTENFQFDTYFDLPLRPTPNTPASPMYESRLYGAPFSSVVVNNFSDSFECDPFLLNQGIKNTLKIHKSCGLGDYSIVSKLDGWNNDNIGVAKQIFDTNPIIIPFLTDKFYNYLIQNESQIRLQMTTAETKAQLGALNTIGTTIGSLAQGNIGSAISAAPQLGNQAIDYMMPEMKLEAMSKDAERWPKNLQLGSGKYGAMLTTNRNRITIQYMSCQPTVKNAIASKFIQYGYTINYNATNFNFRSRYWFNYVKYSNIVCTSNRWFKPWHKTMLEKIYRDGVRLWHYRDGFNQFGKFNLDNTEVY